MHVIQLAPAQWLVLDRDVRPRWLITQAPMVQKATGETHIVHRVEWWQVNPKHRYVVAVIPDGLIAAEAWCRAELDRETESKAALSDSLSIRHQLR